METLDNSSFLESLKSSAKSQLVLVNSTLIHLPEKTLKSQRADGGWSILQCLDHLNTYSNHYLPQIETALAKAKPNPEPKQFKSGWLGKYFIGMMDPEKQSKYKAAKKHLPAKLLNAEQTLASFTANQKKFIELLDKISLSNLTDIRIKTSISKLITLKLGDTLKFLLVHNDRHICQAIKNIRIMTDENLTIHKEFV
nr:DinB family protein [Pedobacter panaciterrae]